MVCLITLILNYRIRIRAWFKNSISWILFFFFLFFFFEHKINLKAEKLTNTKQTDGRRNKTNTKYQQPPIIVWTPH